MHVFEEKYPFKRKHISTARAVVRSMPNNTQTAFKN